MPEKHDWFSTIAATKRMATADPPQHWACYVFTCDVAGYYDFGDTAKVQATPPPPNDPSQSTQVAITVAGGSVPPHQIKCIAKPAGSKVMFATHNGLVK